MAKRTVYRWAHSLNKLGSGQLLHGRALLNAAVLSFKDLELRIMLARRSQTFWNGLPRVWRIFWLKKLLARRAYAKACWPNL